MLVQVGECRFDARIGGSTSRHAPTGMLANVGECWSDMRATGPTSSGGDVGGCWRMLVDEPGGGPTSGGGHVGGCWRMLVGCAGRRTNMARAAAQRPPGGSPAFWMGLGRSARRRTLPYDAIEAHPPLPRAGPSAHHTLDEREGGGGAVALARLPPRLAPQPVGSKLGRHLGMFGPQNGDVAHANGRHAFYFSLFRPALASPRPVWQAAPQELSARRC